DSISYASGVSGPGSSNLGDVAPHLTSNGNPTASVTGGPLLDGTVLTTTFTTNFDDSTGTARTAIVRTATTTVDNAAPTLNLPGAQSQDYHDALSFGISATDANAGDTVSLSASGLPAGLSFTDNGNRTGTVSGTITATPGPYLVTFSANDHHHLAATTGTVLITVTREETTTTYTGVTGPVLDGSTVVLSGVLKEDDTTPIAGRTLTMILGSGGSAQTCTGTTDGTGTASCSILVNQPVGPQPVSSAFAGDTFYLPSSGSDSVVVYTAKSLKQGTLAQATVLLAGLPNPDSNKMTQVVKKLTASLAPELWIDGNHVDPKKGEQVFNAEKEAIGQLMNLERGGSIPVPTLQGMIDTLDHADRILAEDALADAIAASGDPHKIADAQDELAKAADQITAGHFDDAVEHYKHAWKKSQEAVH
ncbi:MAG: Ig domain-containing protein, partial [Gaiellaceae bacterium]